jgi:hypothetical protein
MRKPGRVGGIFDTRVLHTDRSYNYKLRATWLTPEVVRATARLIQLSEALSDEETIALVEEAEDPNRTVFLVEVDPREGSGVVPRDWLALLELRSPSGDLLETIRGIPAPQLRHVRALSGIFRRDYDYDVFWVVFPLRDEAGGEDKVPPDATEARLIVRIYEKQGGVEWSIPESIRTSPAAAETPRR